MKKTFFTLATAFAAILIFSSGTFAAQHHNTDLLQATKQEKSTVTMSQIWDKTAPESAYEDFTNYWTSWMPIEVKAMAPAEKFDWMKETFFQDDQCLANFWSAYFPMQGLDPTFSGESLRKYADLDSAPNFFQNLPKIITNIHTAYEFIPDNYQQETELQRRDYLINLVTMPKKVGSQTNEKRLDLLNMIASNPSYTVAQRSFAKYNLIEQKVKHALVDPTEPTVSYTWTQAVQDYTAILDSHHASPMTEVSVRYHLGELYTLNIDGQTKDPIKAYGFFSKVLDSSEAHPFTQYLAGIKLRSLN